MLNGDFGSAARMALSIVVRVAEAVDADELLDITAAHIDSTVYIGSNDGVLYAINPDSGALKWSHSFGSGTAVSSPSISSGGAVLCGCDVDFNSVTGNGWTVSEFQTDKNSVTDAAHAGRGHRSR